MMQRVETILDPAIEARGFEKIRSTVEVELTDGRHIVQEADERYRGGPDRPFTQRELHEKFSECAALVLAPEGIDAAIITLESLERLTDAAQLMRILAPARTPQG
jgi:2-methylcitrate dehydratase PrpD